MIDYAKIKFHDVTEPKSGYTVYVNKYWLVDGDAKRALFYGNSAQCNNDEEIMKRCGFFRNLPELKEKLKIEPKIVFVPVSYVAVRND